MAKLIKLDAEEQEILQAFEAGKTTPVANADALVARHMAYADATFRKDARINIRLSSKDLRALQRKAISEGMPYQTLVASVLHKYVEGTLVSTSP